MNKQEIEAIRAAAIRMELDGSQRLASMSLEDVAEAYNGTGPEFLPQAIRAKLDDVCRPFLPAVEIHDVDFEQSDGSVGAFRAANVRLLINCLKCANEAYPALSWKRYALYAEAYALYRACERFGWIAWLSAFNKNQKKGNAK